MKTKEEILNDIRQAMVVEIREGMRIENEEREELKRELESEDVKEIGITIKDTDRLSIEALKIVIRQLEMI